MDGVVLEERFRSKFIVEDGGCWIWQHAVNSDGYGNYAVKQVNGIFKTISAHRVAYEAFHGPITKGLELDHLCRNRTCVNPQHLEAVSHLINVRRGIGGRPGGLAIAAKRRLKTHCRHGHELTPGNTYLWVKQNSKVCRTCSNEKYKRYYWRKRGRGN